MGKHSTHEITQLLVAWNQGEPQALEDLTVLLNQELRQLDRRFMADERQGHLLQPTALVNEAWLRLIDWQVSLSAAAKLPSEQHTDLVALDDALQALEKLAPRQARLVELRFFTGLSLEETVEALKVSVGTVRRELNREE